jgi:hypothetical protein
MTVLIARAVCSGFEEIDSRLRAAGLPTFRELAGPDFP